jgi:hypothetical protein
MLSYNKTWRSSQIYKISVWWIRYSVIHNWLFQSLPYPKTLLIIIFDWINISFHLFITKSHHLSLGLWLNICDLKLDNLISIQVHSKLLPQFTVDLVIPNVMHVTVLGVHSFGAVAVTILNHMTFPYAC